MKELNDDTVLAVSKALFKGNYSAGLNFIVEEFRQYSEFSKLLHLLKLKGDYDSGVRTRETIDAKKELESILLYLLDKYV